MFRILTINPGSTSTKLAVFEDENCVLRENVHHDLPLEIRKDMPAQLELRAKNLEAFMQANGLKITDFDMVSARCGFIPDAPAANYKVNQLMLDVLRYAPRSAHASNLATMLAARLTAGTDIITVSPDAPSADEMMPVARISGLKDIPFHSGGHTLSAKQVCRDAAKKLGIPFEKSRMIVAHLGGGSSVSAMENGLIIDVSCTSRGPMSAERAGTLLCTDLIDLCYSGKYTYAELSTLANGRGGLAAYSGSSDALDAENRAIAGDKACAEAYSAMAYQIAKCIGEYYVALKCKVDAIVFTGSLSRSKYLLDQVFEYIRPLAPIEVYGGEREMEALAAAALRVLRGEEKPAEYDLIPKQFKDKADFYRYVETQK